MILRESCSHGCRPWSSTVTEQDGVIVVRAPPASEPVPFPGRGALTGEVDGFHGRTVADVPADSCPVLARIRRAGPRWRNAVPPRAPAAGQ